MLYYAQVRFVLAASHVHYYMLAGSENCVSEYEWQTLLERQLLTEEEKEVVAGYKGMKQFLLITWALQEVKAALYVTDADATAPGKGGTFRTFQTVGFELRGHCGQLVNLLKQPVHAPRRLHTHARPHGCPRMHTHPHHAHTQHASHDLALAAAH